ncbi:MULTISPECIES: ABC transporter substrate-binding protein [unclassified Nocardia]|uniref:ABC transporter substrate-binding protein n=1 Tax=unclassified Nocardia TaxID=2637762 RepID=UPI001CE46756|nr:MULTISPECIES: ABC transporter substrate-binding protein [unclassified Nocardia]
MLALAAVLLCGTGLATGCGRGGGSSAGTLTVLSTNQIEHLDPARNYVQPVEDIGRLIYRSLTMYQASPDGGQTLVPDLATSTGTPSAGARTWTFTLKDGLRFEDGTPITSADIKYGVERTFAAELPEGPPYARMWLVGGDRYKGPYQDHRGLDSIQTPDAKTIVFQLNRPVADFGGTVSMSIFSPVPKAKDNGVGYDQHPVASGPYKIESYAQGKQLALVRNTNWSSATDPVRRQRANRIVIDVGMDSAVVTQRLIAAQGQDRNAIALLSAPASSIGQILGNPAVKQRLMTGKTTNTRYLSLNTTHEPLTDVRVRQAIAWALDKSSMQLAMGGAPAGRVATSLIPPTVAGYVDHDPYPTPGQHGDSARARELLAQAGYPRGGITLTMDTPATTTARAVAEAAQASLATVGIELKINEISTQTFYSTVGTTSSEHDIVYAGWAPDWPGPGTYLPNVFDGRMITAQGNNNYSMYNVPEVNDRFDQIAQLTDPAQADAAYGELQQRILADAAVVPWLWDTSVILVGPNVTDAFGNSAYNGSPDMVSIGLGK